MKKTGYLVLSLIFAFANSMNTHAQWTKEQTDRYRDSLKLVLKNSREDSSRVLTLDWLYWSYFGDSDTDALRYANDALTLSKKIKYNWGEARANAFLGRYWNGKSDHAKALSYWMNCLKKAIEKNYLNLILNGYYEIAGIYFSLTNYTEAINNYLTLLKIAQENKREGMLSSIWLSLGESYFRLGNFEESLKYYDLAYQRSLTNNIKIQTGYILHYMGLSQKAMGKNTDALNNFSSALKLYKSMEDSTLKRHADNDYLKAQVLEETGYTIYDLATVCTDSSAYYYKECISYLNKVLPLYEKGGNKAALIKAYNTLSEAWKAIKNFEKAHNYITLASVLKDSIYSKEEYMKVADLQVKYETEKAAAALKMEQEKEKLRNAAILADQKLEQEKMLADERVANEKAIAEQKLEKEKAIAIAGEKANYEKSIAIEKIRNEKQQTNNLLLMGLILVAITSFFLILYIRQRHQKNRAVEKAEAFHKMAELELQSLRSQLNPHFMFNSLNSIQTLIMKDQTDKSQSYLSRFARLLRMLLENADKPFIPLRTELEFLQLYLSLESLRVPDMQYSISADPALNPEQVLIPNMMLQPYVENAIWHGLTHKETDKQLQIRISKENGSISYEIEDNGIGRKKAEELKSLSQRRHQSKGMQLLNKRIELLNKEYSSVIHTEVADVTRNEEVTGTLVSIKVPLTLSEHSQN